MKPGPRPFPSTSVASRFAILATAALLACPCVVPPSFGAEVDAESQTPHALDDNAAAESRPPSDDTMDRAAALQALADDDVAMRRRGALRLADVGETADVAPLIEALHDDDAIVRAIAERSVWSLWSHSGDDEADRLLALGAEQLASQRLADSIGVFTGIIERWPAFAEAWNKRATALYLAGDLERSAADCREVLRLNPSHFGALSGVGLILLKRGELEHALSYFERALELNPNLSGVRSHRDAVRDELARRGRHET